MRHRKIWLSLLAFLCLTQTNLRANENSPLTAYSATYVGRFSGAKVEIETALVPRSESRTGWILRRWSEPKGFARMIRRQGVLECIAFDHDGHTIMPHAYHYIDGKPGQGKSAIVEYQRADKAALSAYEGETVELSLDDQATDRLTEELRVAAALIGSPEEFELTVIERNARHIARYTKVGNESIKTDAGSFDTVIYDRRRGTSSRTTRFWYAPELDYLPVKIERFRKGKSQGKALLARYTANQALGSVTPVCP